MNIKTGKFSENICEHFLIKEMWKLLNKGYVPTIQ
jgi:hypothetical protein